MSLCVSPCHLFVMRIQIPDVFLVLTLNFLFVLFLTDRLRLYFDICCCPLIMDLSQKQHYVFGAFRSAAWRLVEWQLKKRESEAT